MSRIQFFPALNPIAPRLEALLEEAKQRWPEGVGTKELIKHILEQDNFFTRLLAARGVNTQTLKKEVNTC